MKSEVLALYEFKFYVGVEKRKHDAKFPITID